VLLDGIERVEPATDENPVKPTPAKPASRPTIPQVRRETLAFGATDSRDSGVRLSREPPEPVGDVWDDAATRGRR
jgi:hypothetical protein